MKKILFLTVLFIGFLGFSQTNPRPMPHGVTSPFYEIDTMTTTERDAMLIRAGKGRIIFNSTVDYLQFYNPTTTSWQALSQSTRLSDFTVSQKVNGIFGLSPNDGEIIFEYAGADVTNILFDEAFSKYLVEFETLIGSKSINAVIFNKTQEKTLIGDITAITANDVGGTDYYSTSIELGDMAETDIAVNDEIEVYLSVNENLSNYADKTANNTFTGTQQNFNGKIGLNDATPTTPLTVIHDAPDQTSSQIIASFSDQDLSVGTGVSGVLFGTLSNGTNTYGGYVASQGYEPLYLGTLTNRNSLQIADNGALNFNKYGLNNITGTPAYSLAVDASGNVIEAPLSSGSNTSEWALSTGTRAGGDLVVTLGDYDASAEGTSIKIDDSNGIVDILPYNNATLRAGNIRLTGGSFFASLDIPTLTGNRNIILPDASGTIALTSDITGGGNPAIYIVDEASDLTGDQSANANKVWSVQGGTIDLADASITLPANVYLRNDGGQIINATIDLNGGKIDPEFLHYTMDFSNGKTTDLSYRMTVASAGLDETQLVDEANPTAGELTMGQNNKERLQHMINQANNIGVNHFVFPNMDIWVDMSALYLGYGYMGTLDERFTRGLDIFLHSNTHYDLKGGSRFGTTSGKYDPNQGTKIRMIPNNDPGAKIFSAFEKQNIKFTGGELIGDRRYHDYSPVVDEGGSSRDTHDFGTLLGIHGVHTMLVENVVMSWHTGDCIIVDGSAIRDAANDGAVFDGRMESRNIIIRGCHLSYARRNNISLIDAVQTVIDNNDIIGAGYGIPFQSGVGAWGTLPMEGIDCEPYQEADPNDITNTHVYEDAFLIRITNNRFDLNYKQDVNIFKGHRILVDNNQFTNWTNVQFAREVTISNCTAKWNEDNRNHQAATDGFTAVGGETYRVLPTTPIKYSWNRLEIDSTPQVEGVDFTVSNDTLYFTSPLTASQVVDIDYHEASDTTIRAYAINNALKVNAGGTFELVNSVYLLNNTAIGFDAGISLQGSECLSVDNKIFDFKIYGVSSAGTNSKHKGIILKSSETDANGIEIQNGSSNAVYDNITIDIPNGRGFYFDNINNGTPYGRLVIHTTGGGTSIDGITVEGVQIMSGSESYSTAVATATAVAANINAYTSTPNYTATTSGGTVNIYHEAGDDTGEFFDVEATSTGVDFDAIDFIASPRKNKVTIKNSYFSCGSTGYVRDMHGLRFINNEINSEIATEKIYRSSFNGNYNNKERPLSTLFIRALNAFDNCEVVGNRISSSSNSAFTNYTMVQFVSASGAGISNSEIRDNYFSKTVGSRVLYIGGTASNNNNNLISNNRIEKSGTSDDFVITGDNNTFINNYSYENTFKLNLTGTGNLIKYRQPNPACPSYADNATALATLGEGWCYKNIITGQFDFTHL